MDCRDHTGDWTVDHRPAPQSSERFHLDLTLWTAVADRPPSHGEGHGRLRGAMDQWLSSTALCEGGQFRRYGAAPPSTPSTSPRRRHSLIPEPTNGRHHTISTGSLSSRMTQPSGSGG